MTEFERLLTCIPDAYPTGDSWTARCPVHDDQKTNIQIKRLKGDLIGLFCDAGCSARSICNELGVKKADYIVDSNPLDTEKTSIVSTKELDPNSQNIKSTEQSKEGSLDFRPFPCESLPEPLKSFVLNNSDAIGCDPSYVALPILAVVGSAIGNTKQLRLKNGWTVPPIIWVAVVGESGTSKTPAFKAAMKAIRKLQSDALEDAKKLADEYETELKVYDLKHSKWKKEGDSSLPPAEKPDPPAIKRYVICDTTIEALAPILANNLRGLLIARDELSGWVASFGRYSNGGGSADAAHWLSMFNGDSITIDRKTGDRPTIHIPQAYVSICGGIQPEILKSLIGREHRESGLLARFLLAYPPRSTKRWSEVEADPDIEKLMEALIRDLCNVCPFSTSVDSSVEPQILELTPEAKKVWIDYYNRHAKEQKLLDGDLAAAWSKLEEYAARLALILHLTHVSHSNPAPDAHRYVDDVSMRDAINLTEWFKHEIRRVYAMLSESPEEKDDRKLLHWLRKTNKPVTAREVQRSCRWLKESGKAEESLRRLVKKGSVSQQQSNAGERGQPTRYYQLETQAKD